MGVCEFLFDSQISRNGCTTSEDGQDPSKHCQEMPPVGHFFYESILTFNIQFTQFKIFTYIYIFFLFKNLQITLDMCKWLIYRSSWNIMDFVSNAEFQGLQSEEDEEKWKYHHKLWENWSTQLNARYMH